MPRDLGSLTRHTGAGEMLDVGGHPEPNKTSTDVPKEGIAASMGEGVTRGDDLLHQRGRHDRAGRRRSEGCVAEKLGVTGQAAPLQTE